MKKMTARIRQLAIHYREILSYLIVGVLTTVVGLGTYYLCIYTVLDPADPLMLQAANVISWLLSVTFAYVTNRKFVFLSKDPHIGREMASFYLGRLSTLLLDMGFMGLFVSVLHFNASGTKLVDQVIIIVANYVISKKLVFKKKPAEKRVIGS